MNDEVSKWIGYVSYFTFYNPRQHFLYFLPLPQGQGSFRPGFLPGAGAAGLSEAVGGL